MPSYHPADVERRWQAYWEANKTFRTPEPGDPAVTGKRKFYVLDMFPYPSGAGLHVGHPEGYTATDILCRFKRMNDFHVLHPMGWDAYGLPAEQYAVEKNVHPRITTQQNIDTFRRQIKSLGFSYDWDREVDTTDPLYFRWTQWIFLTIYDTWYDSEQQKGRPISELPIPAAVAARGFADISKYQDDHRLAYQAEVPVNWCPALGTVLANEEVIDGKSERGGHPVERRPLRQWLMRITAYAERLLDDLEPLNWSESIKSMQRNWIGKSEGAEVEFKVAPESPGTAVRGLSIHVFTTRPDTLFGATYMVLSPEHSLVDVITTPSQKSAVKAYQEGASRKSDFERTELAKAKTGVFTGAFAINPVSDEKIPIWIADYVLATYGTGAIMAVPGHDERDFEFANEYSLPIVQVVERPVDELNTASFLAAWRSEFAKGNYSHVAKYISAPMRLIPGQSQLPRATTVGQLSEKIRALGERYAIIALEDNDVLFFSKEEPILLSGVNGYQLFTTPLNCALESSGIASNSVFLNGLPTNDAKAKIIAWLEEKHIGHRRINYKLRDWLFSRQRYWGEPFPILHELDEHGKETGVRCALSVNELPLIPPDLEDFKPTGTPEGPLSKATDWVNVTIDGKKYKRETNTMPQWAGSCWYFLRFIDPKNSDLFADPAKLKYWLPIDLYIGGAEHAVLHLLYSRFWHKVLYDRGYLPGVEPFQRLVNQGMILGENGEKMSKARGNVVNPDDVVKEYGADSLRLYEMFMGPLEAVKPWNTKSIEGVFRFLNRVWRLAIDDAAETVKLSPAVTDAEPDRDTLRELHRTIQRVTDDTEALRFNTAIAAMMEFTNFLTKRETRPRSVVETLVRLLAPYAPHVAEELWAAFGHAETLAYAPWPKYDPALLREDVIEIPVQVNGKLRSKLLLSPDIDAKALEAAALDDETIKALIAGKTVKKVVVVPKKLVNVVVA